MEGQKKKRKMEEADQDEEEKIEKFFALIKSTREVRERMVGAPQSRQTPAADKPKSPPWNPTFVLEDFVETPPPPPTEVDKAGTSMEGENQESDEESGNNKGLDLDLNLSL